MKHRARTQLAHSLRVTSTLLSMLSLACSGATRASSPSDTLPSSTLGAILPPPPRALRESLQLDVGGGRAVAVVASESGIVAVGLNGRQRLLVRGDVEWLFVDDRAGVLWYQAQIGTSYELCLLDWSRPAPLPECVATGLGSERALNVAIAYAESAHGAEEVSSHAGGYDGYVRLLLTASGPVWSYEHGIYDAIFEREAERRATVLDPLAFVPQAEARLRDLNERARGRSLLLGSVALPEPAMAPNVDPQRCWDTSLCGSGQALPGTPWLRVVVMHECGDACHVRYQLFDPVRREFFEHESGRRSPSPIDDGDPGSVRDVWIAARGEGFVIAGAVYDRSGKLLFRGDRRGGGWLGGQWHLD